MGFGLGAGLLQVRDGMNFGKDVVPDNAILGPIAFTSKSYQELRDVTATQREAYAILHGLEKFHHYCFERQASVITSLVTILKKNVATLLQ